MKPIHMSFLPMAWVLATVWFNGTCPAQETPRPQAARPNILVALSDDQSWIHASAYGYQGVQTPAFDRVAKLGVLFKNCVGASPGCSPCRAAFLTGRHPWQIEQAGTHASSFPAKYVTYPDLLEQAGYFVGMTGKGWGPGNWKISGRTRNPAGPEFNQRSLDPPHRGINRNDYAKNFEEFLAARPEKAPFCFWYGASEPHRAFAQGSGKESGKRLETLEVPPFLPSVPEVRSDLADYLVEIEWFDAHLGRMLSLLEKAGELDNTLIIVTSDNGMAFPRAKANMYEYGIHMPLAICWPRRAPGGRLVEDLVGFVDLTATILDAAGVPHPGAADTQLAPAGRSLLGLLRSEKQGLVEPGRTMVFSGRERHSSSRFRNWTYPARAVRTHRFLYIRNFEPDRWPAGDPEVLRADGQSAGPHSGYKDIDESPTLQYLIANREEPQARRFFQLAVAKRPAEELYDILSDPGCLVNLAASPAHASETARLREALLDYLRKTGDPRVGENPEVWESYPRYSPIRSFPPP